MPLLFARLPQGLAGSIAGDLFIAGQGCGLVLGGFVASCVAEPLWRRLARVAWGLDAVFVLLILPVMAHLRSEPGFGPHSPVWGLFMGLHLVATGVYTIEGLLGLAVIGRGF